MLKRTPAVQRGKGFSVGQRETVLLWNISVREPGPPPGEREPGSAHRSGKISMGTPLALHRLVDGAKLM